MRSRLRFAARRAGVTICGQAGKNRQDVPEVGPRRNGAGLKRNHGFLFASPIDAKENPMSLFPRPPVRPLFGAVCLMVAAAAPAMAEVVQIPGPAFSRQCPCNFESAPAVETKGSITPSSGASSYFAALPYAGVGKVCAMSMIYRDVNAAESLTVSLFRKKIQLGSAVDGGRDLVARAVSAGGVPDEVRKASAPTIKVAPVNTANAFYYVQADFQNVNMDLVGVQIDIRESCPS